MKKPTKYVIIAVVSIWLLALAVVLGPKIVQVWRDTSAVETVFDNFTTDLLKREFDTAYGLGGPEFHSALSKDEFLHQQESLEGKFGHLLSVKRQGMHISESGDPVFWRAEFEADYRYEKSTRRFRFAFRKNAGKWVLFGYEDLGPTGQS
jgi:hypothetical protein